MVRLVLLMLLLWPQVSWSLVPFNLERVGIIPESVPAEARDPGRPPFPPTQEKMDAYMEAVQKYMTMPLNWKLAEFRGRGNRAIDYMYRAQDRITWYRGEIEPQGKDYTGGLESLTFQLSDSTSVQPREIITLKVDRENIRDQSGVEPIFLLPVPTTPIPWESFKSESSHQGQTALEPVWYVFFGLPRIADTVELVAIQ